MDYAKTLIVDTNIELYEYSAGIWAEYGIKSQRVDNIEQALEELSVYKYHLIVIVECKEQRPLVLESIKLFREFTFVPIVIASTDALDVQYCITAYDLGVDEVWEMPEHIEEAVAKGNAIIRRCLQFNKEIDKQSTLIVNKHVILDMAQRVVYVRWKKVILKKSEFDLLTLLIAHPGTAFSYERIYREVWGGEYTRNERENIRNHVCSLRKKIRIDPTLPPLIITHQGFGYSFSEHYIIE